MKIVADNGVAVVIMTTEEADHIGHRLNVSSTTTFSVYREERKTEPLHRHPLADDYLAALANAGLWDCEDEDCEEEDC